MNKTNPNDPAFPTPKHDGYGGLTIREIFAKDLTAALISNHDFLNSTFKAAKKENYDLDGFLPPPFIVVNAAIKLADALIQKLNEGKDENI